MLFSKLLYQVVFKYKVKCAHDYCEICFQTLAILRVLIFFLFLHTGFCEVSDQNDYSEVFEQNNALKNPKNIGAAVRGRSNIQGTVKYPFSHTDFAPWQIQSPIDLITSSIQDKALPVLKFINPENAWLKAKVKNSGHTVVVSTDEKDPDKLPSLMGGPLKPGTRYIFEQLHFHWGSYDEWGSEHFINGEAFSVEAHMVFFKGNYLNFKNAFVKDDGLAVLTVFAEASGYDPNNLLEPLHSIIGQMAKPNVIVEIPWEEAMQWTLSSIVINREYYTYPGSLTTPPHTQNVVFILLPIAITISHDQLNAFRTLIQDNGNLMNKNNRKLQPLNHRPIFKGTIVFGNGTEWPWNHRRY